LVVAGKCNPPINGKACRKISANQDISLIDEKTTPGILRQLRNANILKILQPASGRRSSVLCFPRLINLAEGKDVV